MANGILTEAYLIAMGFTEEIVGEKIFIKRVNGKLIRCYKPGITNGGCWVCEAYSEEKPIQDRITTESDFNKFFDVVSKEATVTCVSIPTNVGL